MKQLLLSLKLLTMKRVQLVNLQFHKTNDQDRAGLIFHATKKEQGKREREQNGDEEKESKEGRKGKVSFLSLDT